MAIYSSGNIKLNASAQAVFSKLSNLENLKSLLENVPADKIPEDKRDMFENLKITNDSIEIPGGPVGSLLLKVVERVEPSLIRLAGEGLPIALQLKMNITPETDTTSVGNVDIDIDIPAMLKPMIGGQIQKIADQFGGVISAIPF